MDATQLSLFLNARIQAASRLTQQLNSDPVGSDTAFANMLQQRQTDQVEQQRQLDQERQTWRNQPSSTPPASTAQSTSGPTTTPAAATDSSKSQAADKVSPHASRAQDNAPKATTAAGSTTSSQQSTATTDKASTKSTGKTGKSDDTDTKDTDESGKDQAATASGSLTNHGKQDPQHPTKVADSNDPNGNGGQNQGQNSQDGKSQQGANDGDAATVEGIESTILASLMTGQVPASTGTTSSATGTGTAIGAIPGGGKTPGLGGNGQIAGGQIAGGQTAGTTSAATAATGTTGTAATGAAGLAAAALVIPGPGAGSTTTAAGQAAGNGVSNQQAMGLDPLSQQNRATPTTDLDTTFANIISKKAAPTSTDNDNLHVSVSKAGTDNSTQMPRPLVRIDDSKTPQVSVQPTTTLTETEALSTASSDSNLDPSSDQDMGLDDLRGLGTYSPLMTGGNFALTGKPVDAMTALRQQLANASVQDQVAIHMQRAVNSSVDKISIQLSPGELGRIHVKMTVDDDKQVSATITVEKPATLDLLQRDTKTLERALQDAGLKTDSGSLSFSLQRGNQGDSSDTPGWGQSDGRQIGSGQEKTAAVADISSTTASNAVDTANGLVDVAV